MTKDSVQWGNTLIEFEYCFASRRSLAISVHPDLTVTVKAPNGVSMDAIREKVLKRGAWIQGCLRDFELYLPKQPARRYISGESHRYLGRQYRLKTVQGEQNGVKCLRGFLWVTTKEEPTSENVAAFLDKWYRERARVIFGERMTVCCARGATEGIPAPTMVIKKMSHRWGSCSPTSRVILNLELIKVSKECIDYVIMHELCHLKERHHGPRFWRLLEKLMPDYQERKKKLNLQI